MPAIDKNVPIPEIRFFQDNKEIFRLFKHFEIGDSAFFPIAEDGGLRSFIAISAAISYARQSDKRFAFRQVEENGVKGTRIWRVIVKC